jgi:hypothetical protein
MGGNPSVKAARHGVQVPTEQVKERADPRPL